jgi:hypothetical protein
MHVDTQDLLHFSETLRRCREKGFLTLDDSASVERLANLRNPLSHFRNINDSSNLTRRSMTENQEVGDLLKVDAYFAIGVAIKILSKPPFKVGS